MGHRASSQIEPHRQAQGRLWGTHSHISNAGCGAPGATLWLAEALNEQEQTQMKVTWFVLGIVATLVALSAAAYIYMEQGFVSAIADVPAGALDGWLGSAMDASTARHAPKMTNPVADTPDALLAGAKIYGSRCSICHGSPGDKESLLGGSLNPPAPQFFGDDPPDMAENENYYIIKHGVRMTGMP